MLVEKTTTKNQARIFRPDYLIGIKRRIVKSFSRALLWGL
jgi:hypothetical protein